MVQIKNIKYKILWKKSATKLRSVRDIKKERQYNVLNVRNWQKVSTLTLMNHSG